MYIVMFHVTYVNVKHSTYLIQPIQISYFVYSLLMLLKNIIVYLPFRLL
jgi:hypothetical protein